VSDVLAIVGILAFFGGAAELVRACGRVIGRGVEVDHSPLAEQEANEAA